MPHPTKVRPYRNRDTLSSPTRVLHNRINQPVELEIRLKRLGHPVQIRRCRGELQQIKETLRNSVNVLLGHHLSDRTLRRLRIRNLMSHNHRSNRRRALAANLARLTHGTAGNQG
jgi:hypothetical protein